MTSQLFSSLFFARIEQSAIYWLRNLLCVFIQMARATFQTNFVTYSFCPVDHSFYFFGSPQDFLNSSVFVPLLRRGCHFHLGVLWLCSWVLCHLQRYLLYLYFRRLPGEDFSGYRLFLRFMLKLLHLIFDLILLSSVHLQQYWVSLGYLSSCRDL